MSLTGEAKRRYNAEHYQDNKSVIRDRYHNDWNFESDLTNYVRNQVGPDFTGDVKTYMKCGITGIRPWIESQFTPSMNWDNYGTVWKFRCVFPKKKFEYASEAQAYALTPAFLSPAKVKDITLLEKVERVLKGNETFETKVSIPRSDFHALDLRSKVTLEERNKIKEEYEKQNVHVLRRTIQLKQAGYSDEMVKLVSENDIGTNVPLSKLDSWLTANLETLKLRAELVMSDKFKSASLREKNVMLN